MTEDEALLFVKVKYAILSRDSSTWGLCETYPAAARQAWAWRCARDVEHLAKNHQAAMHCIDLAKSYTGSLTDRHILNDTMRKTNASGNSNTPDAVNAAYSSYYAARCLEQTPNTAAYSAYYAATHAPTHHAKFGMYIDWLVEELVKWELSSE